MKNLYLEKFRTIILALIAAAFFVFNPSQANAQLDLDSGTEINGTGGGAGTGRGLGFRVTSNYTLTSLGIYAGLNNEDHIVTLYSSTDGNQLGTVLAQATSTVGGLGDQFYDINISYNLLANQYYVLSWAPVDQQTGWVSGGIHYYNDTNLPFTVGPILMINGTEGWNALSFTNSLHPHFRLNGTAGCAVTSSFTLSADTVCDGQTITPTNSSTNATTYQWYEDGVPSSTQQNPGAITFGPGAHTISLAAGDGSCTDSISMSVFVNNLPIAAITPSGPQTICAGDSLTLSANPGQAAYSWSTGDSTQSIIVAAAGTYTVDITDNNGCASAAPATSTVSVNPLPVAGLSPNGPQSICDGDSLTLTASTSGLSYDWSTGETTQSITVDTAGTYSVNVTDTNGCTSAAPESVTLTLIPLPSAVITPSGTQTICEGDSLTLSATPGLAAYLWSTGQFTSDIIVTSSGSYSVTVTNSDGCNSDTSPVTTVIVNPAPVPSFTSISSNNLTVDFTGNPPSGVSWAWDFGDGNTDNSQNPSHTYLQDGTYLVCLTVADSNECQATICDSVSVLFVGLGNAAFSEVLLYPNPNSGSFHLSVRTSESFQGELTIYDLRGKQVHNQSSWYENGIPVRISLPATAKGLYFLEMKSTKGKVLKKIRVE